MANNLAKKRLQPHWMAPYHRRIRAITGPYAAMNPRERSVIAPHMLAQLVPLVGDLLNAIREHSGPITYEKDTY